MNQSPEPRSFHRNLGRIAGKQELASEGGKRYRFHPFANYVPARTRIDYKQHIQPQITKCGFHRRRELGRVCEFELDAHLTAILDHQQVQLRAAMRRPEIGFIRCSYAQDILKSKPFPGGTTLRMRSQRGRAGNAQQLVKQTRITQVYFRRLDLPLAEIFMPGRKLANHKSSGEPVQQPAHGWFGYTERARRFGRIPYLAMVVREHRPESPHSRGWRRQSELRQIQLEKSANKLPAPYPAVGIGFRRERQWESSAKPQCVRVIGTDFVERKSLNVNHFGTAGKRLTGLLKKIARCAPENQKLGRQWLPVCQNSKDLEDFRRSLYLVDNNEALPITERRHWLAEQDFYFGLFQIKIVFRLWAKECSRECGFACLARSHKDDDAGTIKGCRDSPLEAGTFNHERNITSVTLKIEHIIFDFQDMFYRMKGKMACWMLGLNGFGRRRLAGCSAAFAATTANEGLFA